MGGLSGPSGLDVAAWKRLCTSFRSSSNDLCAQLSSLGWRLCTEYVDPLGLYPLLSSRLITLDKNPGVRPTGMGKTTRHLLGKAILYVIGPDVLEVAGSSQFCAGQLCRCEAAIHAVGDFFPLLTVKLFYSLMRVMHSIPLIVRMPFVTFIHNVPLWPQ